MSHFQYTVIVPSLEMKRSRAMITPGMLSKAVGVDGRFSGSVRRFPGFARLTFTDNQNTGTQVTTDKIQKFVGGSRYSYTNFKFWKALTIQKGNTQYLLRGFVFHAQAGDDSQYDAVFYYNDSEDGYWYLEELATNITATAKIDVEPQGKFFYYAQRGSNPKVFWHNGSAITSATMGVGNFTDADHPATNLGTWNAPTPTSGGVLDAGTYRICWRYYDSTRNLYSGRSKYYDVEVSTDGYKIPLDVDSISEASSNIEDYDQVEIYRTISTDLAGTSRVGSTFYRVARVDIDDDGTTRSWDYELGSTATDNLNDQTLILQPIYDPLLSEQGSPPQSELIATYQETTFMGGSDETSRTRSQIQWSPLHEYNPEVFPPTALYRFEEADGQLTAFAKAGDFLYAFGDKVVYRLQKVGTQLFLAPLHVSRGIVNRRAWAAVDNELLFVTNQAVALMNASSGSVTHIGALDRLINDTAHWKGNLDNTSCAYDGVFGAVFVLNPDEEEAVVVFTVTNSLATLEDLNWEYVTGCPHPVDGGNTRAFFLQEDGIVLYPDDEGTASNATTMDVDGTVNGTTTTGTNATTLVDSGASFDSSAEGSYVHFLSGAAKGQKAKISSVDSGTQLTIASTSPAPASGIRYAISPVPFRVRFWPLGMQNDGGYPRNLFNRWVVKSMAVNTKSLDGEYTGDNGSLTVGCYRQFGDSLAQSGEIDLDENPADSYVKLNVDGFIVEPGVECLASDVSFELIAVKTTVKYEDSREATGT
jgi:hypothetical protein